MRTTLRLLLGVALAAQPMVAAAERATPAPKPESPFLLCDGRTGHVSLGETLGRLIAITATAGLSETATKVDDGNRRLKALAGVTACDAALAQEDNPLRRAQLASARAIHFLEADQPIEAATAAHTVPDMIGPFAQDWGFQRTLAPRIAIIEATALARQNRLVEAEALAVAAVRAAPYDIALLQKATPFLGLTAATNPEKTAALVQGARLFRPLIAKLIDAKIAAGQFTEAAVIVDDSVRMMALFSDKAHPETTFAYQSLLFALAGDVARSDALADQYAKGIGALKGSGYAETNSENLARGSELLALRAIVRDLAEGRTAAAVAAFRGRGDWLLSPQAAVDVVVARLRAKAPAADLTGSLAETPEQRRARRASELTANLADPAFTRSMYAQVVYFAKQSDFASASKPTWQADKKPRFLIRLKENERPTGMPAGVEFLSTMPRIDGVVAGDAVLLHAALIARSRGLDRFAVLPTRQYIGTIVASFPSATSTPFPTVTTFDAATVIADLKTVVPPPPPPS